MNGKRLAAALLLCVATVEPVDQLDAGTKGLGVKIVGHRGASYDAPENTLASVRLGWEQDADTVEIDVRLSRDGKIVLMHDDTTTRTAGHERYVADQDLAELKKLDAGSWKAERWAGERIPTLAEALATIPTGRRMFVEVKCGVEIVPELKRVVLESGRAEQITVIGFSYETMAAVKEALPQVPVYWLARVRQHSETGEWLPSLGSLVRRIQEANLDGLDLGYAEVITRDYVSQVKQAGLGFHVWTVNSPEDAQRLVEAGVDSITTDRPGWLREQLTKAAE